MAGKTSLNDETLIPDTEPSLSRMLYSLGSTGKAVGTDPNLRGVRGL
jgi:hypothetical protein